MAQANSTDIKTALSKNDKPAPTCRYCSSVIRMSLIIDEYGLLMDAPRFNAFFQCPICGSRSPFATGDDYSQVHDKAYELAVKTDAVLSRSENRVLTLEELKELPEIVWIEQHSGEIEPQIPYAIENNMYCRGMSIEFTDGYSEMFNRYQHTWRCWLHKPTDEERAAVTWKEVVHDASK